MFWTHLIQKCIVSRFVHSSSRIYTRSVLSSVFALGCILLLFSPAAAEQLTLAWDDPNNDPSANGVYRLYYWQPGWEMPASVEVGGQTSYTITGLEAGKTYSFAVTVHDGQGGRESVYSNEISMTFPPPNTAPVAVNDSATTDEKTAVMVSVLDNDHDADGDSLLVSDVSTASKGTVSTDGATVLYTPHSNANGTDSFTYTLSDGQGGSDLGTVTVTITSVNTAPVAQDGTLSTFEDTPVTGILAASDADGDALTYRLLTADGSTAPAVTLAWDDPDNDPSANGVYRLYYWQPSWEMPASIEVGGQTSYTVTGLEAGKTYHFAVTVHDGQGGRESIRSNEISTTVAGSAETTQGTVTLTNATTGAFTYTPPPQTSGTDTFRFQVNDGTLDSNVATVTVTISPVNSPVNNAPIAAADSATTPEGTAVTLSVLANDSDLDGDALTVTAVSPATAGTVTTDGKTVTYTPNSNFQGTDTFTYTVSDGSGGTAIGTVTITVLAANLPPVAYDGSLYTVEDTAVSGTLSASDVDGNALTYRLVDSDTAPQITLAWDDPHNPAAEVGGYRIYYWQPYWEMPASVDIGPHTSHTLTGLEAGQPYAFAITVHDGQGGRESALSNEVSTPGVNPGSGSSGTVTLTDATTGAYTYTPPPQTTGTDTFRFQVNDGTVDSNVATVMVTITSALDEVIDTDGDGLPDDVERDVYGTDPLLADTDGDGVGDGEELDLYGTDPLLADTDGDGVPDGAEIVAGTDPTVSDSSAPLMLWSDYQVTMLLRSNDNDALGVLFRYQDPNNYYRFSWDRQRAYRRLVKCENGVFTLLAEDAVRYVQKRTYQLQIVAHGPHLEVWIDNKQIFAVTDSSLEQGTVALYSWGNAGSQFEAVRVETFPTDVLLLAIETHDGPSANWTVIDEGTVDGPSAWVVEQSVLVQTSNIYSQPDDRKDLAKLGTFALYEIVDTDGDGLPDDVERDVYGTDPLLADTDADGLGDGEELDLYGTDPLLADTDADGISDDVELEVGTDPTTSDPLTP